MSGTRAQEKRWRVNREIGKPAMMGEADLAVARAKVRSFQAQGMSFMAMSIQSGVADSSLASLATGTTRITRRTYEAVMAMHYEPPPPELRGARLPTHGAQRRLQALQAQGFGMTDVGRLILASGKRTDRHQLTRDGKAEHIHYRMFRQIAELYDKLEGVDPLDLGISQSSISKAKRIARERRFPPRTCWDPDTIDDPEAFPEWTGACGTRSGPGIHKREKTRLCGACLAFKYAQKRELRRKREAASVQGLPDGGPGAENGPAAG